MAWPNFLVIGAAKAGTSSLHEYLREHPDVFVPATKEPNFFAFDGDRPQFRGPGDDLGINATSVVEADRYCSLFDAGATAVARGEVSPLYLYDAGAPARIAARVPEARLIVVLREPAGRAYASWLHKRRDGLEPCADFGEALEQEDRRVADGWEFIWHYRRAGRYAEQLERYYQVFPASQIRVFLYDDLVDDAAALMASVYEFIGVDPGFRPDISQRYNPSGVPRSRRLHDLLMTAQLPRRVARRLLPADRRDRIFRAVVKRNLAKPELTPDLRAELVADAAPDIDRLEAMIGRDLSRWR